MCDVNALNFQTINKRKTDHLDKIIKIFPLLRSSIVSNYPTNTLYFFENKQEHKTKIKPMQ